MKPSIRRLVLVVLPMLLLAATGARAEDTSMCKAGGDAWRAGKAQDAIDNFTKCIDNGQLEPATMSAALASRGNILSALGAPKHAMDDFNKSLQIDPNQPGALFGRGTARYELGDAQGALDDFNKLVELQPTLGAAYLGRANVENAMADYQSAIADYSQALSIDPGNAVALNYRGWAKVMSKDYDGGIADMTQSLQIQPNDVLAYMNRAWAHYLKGDPQNGIDDAKKAVDMAPDKVGPNATYAHLLAAVDRPDDALAAFEKAMSLGGKATITAYQSRLQALGYDPGPVDGGYGERTKEAIKACIVDHCNLLSN